MMDDHVVPIHSSDSNQQEAVWYYYHGASLVVPHGNPSLIMYCRDYHHYDLPKSHQLYYITVSIT